MPTTAQDRIRRGPLAALLILLSLFATSGTATAGSDLRSPARLGTSRHGPATAVLPSGTRNSSDDEPLGSPAGASVPPSAPDIVTERLWTRPRAETPIAEPAAPPRPRRSAYRARAPPAS